LSNHGILSTPFVSSKNQYINLPLTYLSSNGSSKYQSEMKILSLTSLTYLLSAGQYILVGINHVHLKLVREGEAQSKKTP
jgi:hypothetical protein